MPSVMNQGVRIHYQVEGQGPPLVLQHGFTDSLLGWYERGYVEGLKYRNRLILIEARGHHLSDKPHEEAAYSIEFQTSDVIAVLDELGIPRSHYFGYSMGGLIGFGLARHFPDRMGAMILGGASPSAAAPPGAPDPMMPALLLGPAGVCSFYEGFLDDPVLRARLLASDMEALIACRRKRFANPGFDEFLANATMPCLLYAGEADPIFQAVQEGAAKMRHAEFFSLPGLKHLQAGFASDLVLPHVTKFLSDKVL